MDVALIQDAEHDVDGDERGEDEQRLVGERGLERGGGALEGHVDADGEVHVRDGLVDGVDGVADGFAVGQVEADGGGWELALMTDGE